MKKKVISIVEITETHLKIVEFSGSSMTRAAAQVRVKNIQDSSVEGITRLLGSMVTARMKKSFIVLILPRQQMMVRYLSLPSHNEEEIKKMVSLQIVGQVPYARENIVFDHVILSKNSSGYSTVLVGIVHSDIIDRYFEIFLQCRLDIEKIQISSAALTRWFYFYHQMEPAGKEVAFLNIDAFFSEFCFCKEQKLFFSRHIHFGAKDLGTEREEAFVREIVNTLEAYQKEKIASSPNKVFLFFSEEYIKNLSEKIALQTHLPIRVINPQAVLSKVQKIAWPERIENDYYSLAALFGGYLHLESKEFNFLPPGIDQKRKTQQKKIVWIRIVILIILNLMIISGLLVNRVWDQKTYFENFREKIETLKPRVDSILRKKSQIDVIEQYLDLRPLMVDVLYELYQITPDDVSFRLIHISNAGDVTLQGIAQSLSSVNSFQGQLVHSTMFKDVNLQYATQRRVFQGEITDFRIMARMIRP